MILIYLTVAIYATASIIVFNWIRTNVRGGAITAVLATFIAYEVAVLFPTGSILVALAIISRHIIVGTGPGPRAARKAARAAARAAAAAAQPVTQ